MPKKFNFIIELTNYKDYDIKASYYTQKGLKETTSGLS